MKMYYYIYKCVLFSAKSLMELFKVAMNGTGLDN